MSMNEKQTLSFLDKASNCDVVQEDPRCNETLDNEVLLYCFQFE